MNASAVLRLESVGVDPEAHRDLTGALQMIFETSQDAYLIATRDHRIWQANTVLCLQLGYEPEELDGVPLETLMPRLVAETHQDLWLSAFRNRSEERYGSMAPHSPKLVRKDGGLEPAKVTVLIPAVGIADSLVVARIDFPEPAAPGPIASGDGSWLAGAQK